MPRAWLPGTVEQRRYVSCPGKNGEGQSRKKRPRSPGITFQDRLTAASNARKTGSATSRAIRHSTPFGSRCFRRAIPREPFGPRSGLLLWSVHKVVVVKRPAVIFAG